MTHAGTEIDLQIPCLIPESYLADIHLRLQCYKRIASAKNEAELDDVQIEMIDRFGLLPEPAKNLIAVTLLKQRAQAVGIKKIEANSKGGKFEFNENPQIDPLRMIQLIQQKSAYFKLDGPNRLRFNFDTHERNTRISLVNGILDQLVGTKNQ